MEILLILIETPFAILLALAGIIFIGIALLGQIPFIKLSEPLSLPRCIAVGTFGISLLGVSLLLTIILSQAGSPSTTSSPTDTPFEQSPSDAATAAPSSSITYSVDDLGIWEYMGNRPPMPSAAEENQVIVAHGDIDNSGDCHVKIFESNETIQGLGEGTFRLWRISGTPEQIDSAIANIQQGAAAHAGSSCPILP